VGGCVYEITRPPFVVGKNDLTVINPSPERILTLTTCHPKGSAAQRLVIRAKYQKELRAA
jgi:sortase (surface protein transpeptidase)